MTEVAICAEVQALERLDLEGLRAHWRRRWDTPPRLRSRDLMAYATAYRLQAEAYGDLPSPAVRRLADLARNFMANARFRPDPRLPFRPGCSLVREWGGARHEVQVLEQGFGYGGQHFASLSAVAFHITGAKRSGHLFFGLKTKVAR